MKLNEIYNGDCLELMKLVPDKSVDMILCDLPYGTTACKWDVIIPFEQLWKQYERIIKDNGAIVLTAAQPFTSALVTSNIKLFKYDWNWNKKIPKGFLNCKIAPMRQHEDVLVFYKHLPTYNPQMRYDGKKTGIRRQKSNTEFYRELIPTAYIDDGSRFPVSTIDFIPAVNNNGYEKTPHPTQKPVALFEYLIKTYTNEGETVMDNCSGSGTTAIACIRTNRNYICMEKDFKYYEMSKERVRKELEQTKLALAI